MEEEEKQFSFEQGSIFVKVIVFLSIIFVALFVLIIVIAFLGECGSNEDCPQNHACKNRECVSLTTERNCGSLGNECEIGEYCDKQTLSCVKEESNVVEDINCSSDADCEKGICENGTCYELSGCFKDEHCNEGEICKDSECIVPECTSDSDCASGEKCVNSECFDENANCSVTGCSKNSCCIQGECIPQEEYLNYNCSTLGYECGSHSLCNKYLYCGDCLNDEECRDGVCITNSSLRLQIIFEKNSYEMNDTKEYEGEETEYTLIEWNDEIENKENAFEGLVFYKYSNNEGNSGTFSSTETIEEGTQPSNINKRLNISEEGDYIFLLEVYNCSQVNDVINASNCGEESDSLRIKLEEISPIESTFKEIEVYNK